MRALITGANGGLGRVIVPVLSERGWDVAAGGRTPDEHTIPLDITDRDQCRRVLTSEPFDAIVHLAAIADPDLCQRDPELARRVNVLGTKNLLEFARHSRFVFASTDYVFDGRSPPYAEEDDPDPLNTYGETKAEGERLTMNGAHSFLILRLPLAYSIHTRFLHDWVADLRSGQSLRLDDSRVRRPTMATDIATALVGLLDRAMNGIFHLSAREGATMFEMGRFVSEWMRRDPGSVEVRDASESDAAPRPHDARLSTGRIDAELGCSFRGYSQGLPSVLEKLEEDEDPIPELR